MPRQNGKNAILEIRELYGMVMLAEKFLHTAHEVKTARKAFARLLGFFDNPRQYPELADMVKDVRRTNGQEAIFLTNGGSVEFIARSKGSGRGFTVDVLVMDEAQELSDDTLAALLPTISAAPQGNPQTILTGTPPSPSMNGEVFTRMRETAIAGKDKRLCWLEWSCAPEADLSSVDAIAQANPALGVRLGGETIDDERAAMDIVTFGRERGGMWDETAQDGDRPIGLDAWAAICSEAALDELAAFGIAVSLDRGWSAIGAAGLGADTLPRLELVKHDRGTSWVVDRCVDLDAKHPGATFVVDGGGPAASLIEPLRNSGLTVEVIGLQDHARACAWLVDAVTDAAVFHGPDPILQAAVEITRWRNAGDQKVFGRRASQGDISALEAVTLAAHILPTVTPLDSVTATFI